MSVQMTKKKMSVYYCPTIVALCVIITLPGSMQVDFIWDTPACGVSPIQPRIINGLKVPPNRFPWNVFLEVEGKSNTRSHCGGSIITIRHIVTAGHCMVVKGGFARTYKVFYGHVTLARTEKMEGSEYIIHPKYDDSNLHNDIAVLVLPSPLIFSASVSAICVPTKPLSIEGSTGVISGWGYPKEETKRTTTHMMYVTQKVQPQSFCEAALMGQPYNPSTMFCAYKHTYDACQGDSGGGFWVPVGSRWVLVGIVSYGIGCGVPEKPGIYTDLASYLPWIRNVVKL